MKSQAKRVKKKPLGLIVGQTADLPQDFLRKHQIEEVPFRAKFPSGEILSKENLFPKLKEAVEKGQPLPSSSLPSFGDFLTAYKKGLERFDKVLLLTVSSKLSGTYSSARIARSMLKEKRRLTVFDCFTVEVAEGLIAIRAQELISQGKALGEVLKDLKQFCPKVALVGYIQDFKYILRSGRVKLPPILLKPVLILQKLGLRLLIQIKELF